jgi:hypothetical protein
MCGVDVRRITEVVGVPGEVQWRLGGIIDPRGRREPWALRSRGSHSGEQ